MSDEDDKKTELPLGKEAEANLFKSRSIFIYGGITQELAQKVCSQLVALAAASDDDIRIFVSSPGGHVESGDSIHDMIKFIKPKVWMIGTGWVASAGALIYVSVPKEQRLCLPNTRFLLHQPSGGTRGMASDIEIQAREIIKMNERLNRIFADATGQPVEKIAKDTDRDYWLSAEEAKGYGLVSRIISSQAEI
ncbi:MAG: ATP-dependent Clp protease proteolytic subunit [Rhizobiales bacterium 63-7]|uniref:ATP-dependent Clp protease proteolytic subunit n=1 Tax=Rhizobium sp. YJ-22 TaxID=3037556 RepID=UPI00092A650B|nr:ATP-dependent Clp protease proteolytic subunit [Rhizobium sp. YJ-22]MBN9032065.1 ATP-dependent Clp protease proteolytic subunit [Hyphomicrobiales bacterium]MDG3576137.1 ATP-dependent Clp protease proteolytic subunit [Rhizobium sp. YJ-22]OJU69140.1 MAG: ATP-dependent Clp protease proteolytic subunit [Rhizobiales bacterium 63-7]